MARRRRYRYRFDRAAPAGRRFVGSRAGNAGIASTLVMALAGVVVGAAAAFVSQSGETANAVITREFATPLREGASGAAPGGAMRRDAIVERILSGGAPERLPIPTYGGPAPKIIIVFDDVGLDRAAFDVIMELPGPVTLSFLPYANGIEDMSRRARERGDAILAHVPMEPNGVVDPGPDALLAGMSPDELVEALDRNLARVPSAIGVNNHMGSRLTRDQEAMETVLSALDARGLFFLDSVTTSGTAVRSAGRETGVVTIARDVFLDAEAGQDEVIRQLAQVETIARETGYAIAICHPRVDTLAAIGPWLTSAPSRGFELATVDTIMPDGVNANVASAR